MTGGFLLDTNLVSEPWKARPDPTVMAWLASADEDRCFISVVTLAEIRFGIEIMPQGKRRQALSAWLEDELIVRFDRRILALDRQIADVWGHIVARGRRVGISVAAVDGFLAATAAFHDLTLATRNVRDFAKLGVPLHDPWQA